MMSFAEECLDTGRFNTSIPWQYAGTLRWVCRELGYPDALPAEFGVGSAMERIWEGYSAVEMQHNDRLVSAGCFAALAVKAGKPAIAHKILSDVDYVLYGRYLDKYYGIYNPDISYLAWVGGGQGAKVPADLGQLLARDDVPEAVREHLLLEEALERFRQERSAGEWFQVFKQGAAPDWIDASGEWVIDSNGRLKKLSSKMVLMPLEVSLTDGFELEYTVGAEKVSKDMAVMAKFVQPGWHSYNQPYVFLGLHGKKVSYSGGRDGSDRVYESVPFQPSGNKERVRIVVRDGAFSVFVNDQPILEELAFHDHPRYKDAAVQIRIGGAGNDMYWLDDIRVRCGKPVAE
jgi:hypothetical protein